MKEKHLKHLAAAALLTAVLVPASIAGCIAAKTPAPAPIKPDNLKHWLVVWVVTANVPAQPKPVIDPYRPSFPPTATTTDTAPELKRIVYANEYVTKPEAETFIDKAPKEIKLHMHLINEDE